MENINYKIYALKEKNSGEIRYIGQTKKSINERLKYHLRDKQVCHRTNWIQKNKNNIETILIEENIKTKEEICEKEIYYISKYRKEGYKLVNTTNGGEGWFNIEFSKEHKLNISKNHADVSGEKNPMFGKTHTEESIKNIKEKFKKWVENVGYSIEQINDMKERSKGSGNSKAKLNESDVLEIRKLYKEGNITHNELAIKYNVKTPAIFKVINKLNWKHI